MYLTSMSHGVANLDAGKAFTAVFVRHTCAALGLGAISGRDRLGLGAESEGAEGDEDNESTC